MSTDVRIDAQPRAQFGKGAARKFRRKGWVPATMYGSGSEVKHMLLPEHDLHLALRIPRVVLNIGTDGSRLLVAPRDVQRDPVRLDLLHVDLILLSAADVAGRHAYAAALAKAEAAATEAGLDPLAAAALIEEAAANEEDLEGVADRIVPLLEEQARTRQEASAAAEAREESVAETETGAVEPSEE